MVVQPVVSVTEHESQDDYLFSAKDVADVSFSTLGFMIVLIMVDCI